MDTPQQMLEKGERKIQTLMAYCVPHSIVYLLLAIVLAYGAAASFTSV